MSKVEKLWGKVIKGKKRGRNLGFPTANIKLHKKIPEGVYISLVKISRKKYPSLTFIGNAKTFLEIDVKVESYIMHFTDDLYGKWISIRLLKKIRGNKKFISSYDLLNQMKKDEQIAKEYFKDTNYV